MTLWINNESVKGKGEVLTSFDPVSQKMLWQGNAATTEQVDMAVLAAREAFVEWKQTPFFQREVLLHSFVDCLKREAEPLAVAIAKETGKPLWEARTEVSAMVGKAAISIQAYHQRTGEKKQPFADGHSRLAHYPLGVMVVLGPYNFPAHLPNGHIVPALLAGNTVVFKPSELTPKVAELTMQIWLKAGLPKGVINLVQGARDTGEALLKNEDINAVLFTGSAKTGQSIHRQFAGKPEKMLALEMGGNNPLVVSRHYADLNAAVYTIIQSAFISSGQRCTCARRLFVPRSQSGDLLLDKLIKVTKNLKQGAQFDEQAPFMGSLISDDAANNMLVAQANLLSSGAEALIEGKIIQNALVTPAIIDVSKIKTLPDEEYFAPLLQVIRYSDLKQAVEMANDTKFGLSAGIITSSNEEWEYFLNHIQAGIVNRNKPLTGASSELPFGGVGISGNLRPSAFYAADYCAYPVASMETDELTMPEKLSPGINFN